MNKTTTDSRSQKITYTFYILIGLQIIIGILWMILNASAYPKFGDSNEYIELSETLVLDEYRPILYPLILRGAIFLENIINVSFKPLVYLAQNLISFLSIFYGISVIDSILLKENSGLGKRIIRRLAVTLSIITIPMITFLNFSILTDSLATSMLILLITELILMLHKESLGWYHYLIMGMALLVQSLLRADRQYSCLLLTIIFFLVRLVKEKQHRIRILAAMLCVCLLVPLGTRFVNSRTQTPGIHGRIHTNLDFILLDRIVWPHMTENYESFPDEIKAIVSFEDAQTFDYHNNFVMYHLAPIVEEAVGEEEAGQVYRTMARIVWQNQPLQVIGDITEDIVAMIFTPISSFLSAFNLCQKGDNWNIECMSTETPVLTKVYSFYYEILFMMILLYGLISRIRHTQNSEARKTFRKVIRPYTTISLIFTLWFCLGDGAPPNDRYALIIYVTWGLIELGILGVWNQKSKKASH